MSSFNAFVQKTKQGNNTTPVWLGVVSPRPVGGKLNAAFCKAGIFVPAGTPVNLDGGILTPFYGWEVVSVDSSTHAITVKGNEYGIVPAENDCLVGVGSTFATTGAVAKVSSVVASGANLVITMTDDKLDSKTAGDVIVPSSATSAATSGGAIKYQPNGYLYNDIAIEVAKAGETMTEVAATGAVVDFHGEGILINRTPAAPYAAQMKVAVPNVAQVGY